MTHTVVSEYLFCSRLLQKSEPICHNECPPSANLQSNADRPFIGQDIFRSSGQSGPEQRAKQGPALQAISTKLADKTRVEYVFTNELYDKCPSLEYMDSDQD